MARHAFFFPYKEFSRGSLGSGALVRVPINTLDFLSCALLFSRYSPDGGGRGGAATKTEKTRVRLASFIHFLAFFSAKP